MWAQAVRKMLPAMQSLVPPGSRVLEVGYGDGLLTCYLSSLLSWQITGLDVRREAYETASAHSAKCGLSNTVQFLICKPADTQKHDGIYDAVFIKTVLYSSPTLDEYAKWLDWIGSVLRPNGTLINFETGRANRFTQFYRRLRGRPYTNLCLYTKEIEALYDSRFQILERRYYGGWSQFFAPVPLLYSMAYRIEEALHPRNADNCFIVSIIARKRSVGAQS